MERAEAMFTGTAKCKIIAEIHFDNDPDTSYKVFVVVFLTSLPRLTYGMAVLEGTSGILLNPKYLPIG